MTSQLSVGRSEAAKMIDRLFSTILEIWESRCLEKVQAASMQTLPALRDSMPKFLKKLSETMCCSNPAVQVESKADVSREHAEDRAQQKGYTLDQMIYEYHLFRDVIAEQIGENRGLGSDTAKILNDFVDTGIRKAAVTYAEIVSQREAAALVQKQRVKDELYKFFMEAPVPMAIMEGREHRVTLANPLYELLVGRKVVGKTTAEAYETNESASFLPLLDKVFSDGIPHIGKEIHFQLKNEQKGKHDIWVNIGYHPFRDDEGEIKGIFALVQDVTYQVQARKDMELNTAELVNAVGALKEERAMRERFVATLTHDLRTPLTAAKITGQLIGKKAEDPASTRALLKRLILNIDRVDGLVQNILDVNSLQAGEEVPVILREHSLNDIIENYISDFEAIYGAIFDLRLPAIKATVRWDADGVRRILENLVGNAVKYGREKGRISIALKLKEEGLVEMAVHNFGAPIPPQDQKNIFVPYLRTKTAQASGHKGWGIGLTLVQAIAAAHGGKVRVESSEGNGTTFFVCLPVSAGVEK